jgi:hypothetical protein
MEAGDLLLSAHLVALRCALPLAMRMFPLPMLLRLVAPRRVSTSSARAGHAIARSEKLARRLHVPDTCLYRAMARFVGLRAAGIDARFRMGVCRDDIDLAHAWVDVGGVPVGEPANERLAPTYAFP